MFDKFYQIGCDFICNDVKVFLRQRSTIPYIVEKQIAHHGRALYEYRLHWTCDVHGVEIVVQFTECDTTLWHVSIIKLNPFYDASIHGMQTRMTFF